jgi:hypothetical protein
MNLRSDPRFESYVEDMVAKTVARVPLDESNGRSFLPILLVGIAGLSLAGKIMTSGAAEVLAADILGAALLATLASLCWLSESPEKPVRLSAVASPRQRADRYDERLFGARTSDS